VNTKDGVCITHNRDEDKSRAENTEFVIRKLNRTKVTMPIDSKSGGTWIAMGSFYTLAIINGGKEIHHKKETYPKSRGNIIPLFFEFENFEEFEKELAKQEYEPFTLVYYDSKNHDLRIITRSEEQQSIKILDPNVVHTWSSATLYTEDLRKARDQYFKNIINTSTKADDIYEIHSDKNGITENYFNVEVTPQIKTVAITQISFTEKTKQYRDTDLIKSSSKLIISRK
jgi:uncharacterized protein with NRDE domain